jgi:hypothetical protein
LAAMLWHLGFVKAAESLTGVATDASEWNPASMDRFLRAWVDAVNDYLKRQYREIIQQKPAAEKLSQYRLECKWLLRSALKLDSLVKDPEYPARHFAPEIGGKLLQLQESWDSLNSPMTEIEADSMLQKAFPDEPRSGGSA